ncbi:MAG: polysaccharide biosynthesis tyrosine autokinase [Bacteroidia bacterium]|nr:polysaccharide biosynthesis tyrosine autokinase [Bacteroidia bacterium]
MQSMSDNQQDYNSQEQSASSFIRINQKHLINTIIHFWWVFVVCAFLGGAIAMFINHYTQPVYMSKTTVLLHDESDRRGIDLTEGIKLSSSLSKLQNQTYIYKSPMMVEHALKHLDFNVTYYRRGKLRDIETYGPDQYINVVIDTAHHQPIGVTFELNAISDDKRTYELHVYGESAFGYDYRTEEYTAWSRTNINDTYTIKIGEPITTDMFSFTILPFREERIKDFYGTIAFNFNTVQGLVNQWAGSISMYPELKESSITNITCVGYNSRKTVDFLSALNQAATEYNLEKKNAAAERTLNFIKRQLSLTSDSLRVATARLSNFKKNVGFTGNSEYGSTLQSAYLNQNMEIEALRTNNDLLSSINRDLEKGKSVQDFFISSTAAQNNPLVSSQLQELINLQKEIILTEKEVETHPYRRQVREQEEILRSNIMTLISQSIELNNKRIAELEKANQRLINEAGRLPELENKRVDLDREYKIQDAVYTFMLQKESETLIAKASTIADGEILREPVCIGTISPQTQRNLYTGLGLGLAIPLVFFVLMELLNKKIRTFNELKDTIKDKKPLVAIPVYDKHFAKTDTPSLENPNCATSEAFRQLRLKLNMLVLSSQNNVVMFTSCNPGEGKTYCAVNTAIAMAQSDKKTLIINYDLRRPRMEEIFPQKSPKNITEYLLGLATEDEIIQQSDVKNLYYITCDCYQLPPNPSEQIASQRNMELINSLRQKFDIIILDTAPIGCVSDCKALEPLVGSIAFVVRGNVTEFEHLESTLEDLDKHKTYLIYNGAQKRDMSYRRYYHNYYADGSQYHSRRH